MSTQKKIIFRADGYKQISLGHVYRCLTIADLFKNSEILFVTLKKGEDGISLLQDKKIPYVTINSNNDFFKIISEWKPDIVVIDCLNSDAEYIKKIKSMVKRVVAIEDVGDGSKYADAVINALYNYEGDNKHYFVGEKYHCLREEFRLIEPKEFSESVNEILITFGGADPSNLTKKLYLIVKNLHHIYPNIHFTFICGPVYDCKGSNVISNKEYNISVLQNINNISEYMKQSDLAISSQGSAIFELASLGIPSIVMAQNKREQLHTFSQLKNGYINLGLGDDVSDDCIKRTIEWLIETPKIREEMRTLLLSHDMKNGAERVYHIILDE